MLPEDKVFQILDKDVELNALMDNVRGGVFSEFGQGIFTYQIPETYIKKELAPFVRINPIDENAAIFADDDNLAEYQTVQVDFWCKTARQAALMKQTIDEIMKRNGFVQYASTRYEDPDIALIMNVRKYQVFEYN